MSELTDNLRAGTFVPGFWCCPWCFREHWAKNSVSAVKCTTCENDMERVTWMKRSAADRKECKKLRAKNTALVRSNDLLKQAVKSGNGKNKTLHLNVERMKSALARVGMKQ
jgi:hypothetical protein